jgi:hypothetical protein
VCGGGNGEGESEPECVNGRGVGGRGATNKTRRTGAHAHTPFFLWRRSAVKKKRELKLRLTNAC